MKLLVIALLAATSVAQAQLFVLRSQTINRVEVPSMGKVPADGMVRTQPCDRETLRFAGDFQASSLVTLESGGALVSVQVQMRDVHATGKETQTEYRNFEVLSLASAAGMLPNSVPAVFETRFRARDSANDFWARITIDLNIDASGRVMATLGAVELECRK